MVVYVVTAARSLRKPRFIDAVIITIGPLKKSCCFFFCCTAADATSLTVWMWFIHLNKNWQKVRRGRSQGEKKKKKLLYTKAASVFQILALEPSQLVPSVLSLSGFIVKLNPIAYLRSPRELQRAALLLCKLLAASVQAEM